MKLIEVEVTSAETCRFVVEVDDDFPDYGECRSTNEVRSAMETLKDAFFETSPDKYTWQESERIEIDGWTTK